MKKFIYLFVLFILFAFLKTDVKGQWVQTNLEIGSFNNTIYSLAATGSNIYAGTSNERVWYSSNDGVTWQFIHWFGASIVSLFISGTDIYAGTDGYGAYKYIGSEFTSIGLAGLQVRSFAGVGSYIIAGTNGNYNDVYRYNGTSWTPLGLPKSVYSVAVKDNYIYAGTDDGVWITQSISTPSWTKLSYGNGNVLSLAVGTYVYAGYGGGTGDKGVYIYNGTTYVSNMLAGKNVYSLAVSGTNVFAGTDSGIYCSINNGTDWTQKNEGFGTTKKIYSLIIKGDYIFAGAYYNGLWKRLYNEVLPVELALFNYTLNGNDVKLNWVTNTETNNSGFDVERRAFSGEIADWQSVGFVKGQGTKNTPTNYFYEDKKLQTGKYKYRLKQIDYNSNFEYHELKGVVEIGIPLKYALEQNYPNPFNPKTVFRFSLSVDSDVLIKVYDVMGKEVAVLVKERLAAGTYTTDWDASGFSSGVYFYRMSAGRFSSVKRMVVVK